MKTFLDIYPKVISCCLLFTSTCYSFAQEAQIQSVDVVDYTSDSSSEKLIGNSDFLLNSDDVSSDQIKRYRAVSLGQTIEKVSGVQNNSMGPNNGQPQIRSLTGSRVYVSENGLAVSDVAGFAGTMPLAVNPFLAEGITVRKSSASVLFGGNAIGGAVDVNTALIPNALPERIIQGKVEFSGGPNATRLQAFSLNGRAGKFAWHIDGMNNNIYEYKIPGNSKADICYDGNFLLKKDGGREDEILRRCQTVLEVEYYFEPKSFKYINKYYLSELKKGPEAAQAYIDRYGIGLGDVYSTKLTDYNKYYFEENPDYDPSLPPGEKGKRLLGVKDKVPTIKGVLSNSHLDNQNISVGGSFVGKNGYIGIAYSRYQNEYGVPGFATLVSKVAGADVLPVNIISSQNRWQLEGLYRPNSKILNNIKVQAALTDADNNSYLGHIFASSLNSRSKQIRVELNHSLTDWSQGSFGIDARRRDITSRGADKFLPDTQSDNLGIFLVEKLQTKYVEAELGYRLGKVKHTANPNTIGKTDSATAFFIRKNNSRSFDLHSTTVALTVKPINILRLRAQYSRSQRAPEVNELFAHNRNFANLVNENGDPELKKETAETYEAGAELSILGGSVRATAYKTYYKDYIYAGFTGGNQDGDMARREWRQGDTKISGLELEWTNLWDLGSAGELETRLFADIVKNQPVAQYAVGSVKDISKLTPQQRHDYLRSTRDGNVMPNLPTSRYGASLNWKRGGWQFATSVTRYKNQTRLGRNTTGPEISLGGYTMVDAYASYSHKIAKNFSAEWFMDARNLTNTEARPHNSILRFIAPLPGRSVRAGLKVTF
ncbi:TonB-dependent receptor [Taylorella equigenitalis]|uniref:TonB-dependent receptor n=1 Tax=Taylorella equigenitalis TaxID=29575 RepID=UPI00237C64B7|nr:TonB-dependent receptor [Taylorella equigenitalis]WDU54938.1 TonB-dependent receptor [Taylorella equigenitalis]